MTVIFLHGKGSQGDEFEEEFAENKTTLEKTVLEHTDCEWVFPNAHLRWSSLFQEEMTEWFDIRSLSNPEAEQETQIDGLKESVEYINCLIDEELQTTPASKIILGGISQGSAVAIHVLLSRKETFAGFIGISGWTPLRNQLQSVAKVASAKPLALMDMYRTTLGIDANTTDTTLLTPVWMSHSADDDVIDFEQGEGARDLLKKLGFKVGFHRYEDGEHWLQAPAGHDDLVEFITARL